MDASYIGTRNPLSWPRCDINGAAYNQPATTVGIDGNHFVVSLNGKLTPAQRTAIENLLGISHEKEGQKDDGVHDTAVDTGRASGVDGERPNRKRSGKD
jgi:hypothetical protein